MLLCYRMMNERERERKREQQRVTSKFFIFIIIKQEYLLVHVVVYGRHRVLCAFNRIQLILSFFFPSTYLWNVVCMRGCTFFVQCFSSLPSSKCLKILYVFKWMKTFMIRVVGGKFFHLCVHEKRACTNTINTISDKRINKTKNPTLNGNSLNR